MQTVLIVIHLMVVITLVVVVLLQRSEGGALGMGGGSGFMTGRGQANVLTRATAILATLFFLTSLGLTLLANYTHGSKSILDGVVPSGPSQQAPTLPPKGQGSVFDQLRKIEEQRANKPGEPQAPVSGGANMPSGQTSPGATNRGGTTPATPPSPASGPASPAKTPPAASAPAPTEPTGTPDKPASEMPATPKPSAPATPPASK